MTYINHYRVPEPGEQGPQLTHSWREHTRTRLEWLYGYDRARRIDYGVDAETQADVARWNMLGRVKDVA